MQAEMRMWWVEVAVVIKGNVAEMKMEGRWWGCGNGRRGGRRGMMMMEEGRWADENVGMGRIAVEGWRWL